MRIALHPAFILHSRAYRETSLLLDVFTENHGLLSLISRGVRKSKSPMKAILQPFNPLLVSWQGRSELMTLTGVESQGAPFSLRGSGLLSGFYLNEILIRLLHKQDPNPDLYTVYRQTLVELQSDVLKEKTLRLFEKHLLENLGYGLQFDHDIATLEPLKMDKLYRYYPEEGFALYEEGKVNVSDTMIFIGKSLIAFAKEQLDDDECLRDAKRLMRMVLSPILGSRPLQSRKLFRGIK